ncbi:PAS domain S-box-containing protein [Lacibacter cauensis]|uniref:PAS domain S-box-containing protein n=1 Tax=Lacibacter cauensis TaxID=510947 RepID=A0A562SQC0_9BACT|nr:PAS domain S-box protein [Lacibacter cauensis]TWI83368.1 PAS domain S-box-containing protein [Lacibacter cauensis]
MSALPGCSFILTPDGCILAATADCSSLASGTDNNVQGRLLSAVLQVGNNQIESITNLISHATATNQQQSLEASVKFLTGVFINCKHTCKPVMENGQLQALIYTVEQIPEVGRYDKFRVLLDLAPEAIIISNDKGIIEFVNTKAEQVFQFTKQEMVGSTVEMLIPQQLREKHQQQRATFVKEQRMRAMQTGIELKAVRKDGHIFPADIALAPVRSEEGNYMMVTVRDITERKKAQEDLESLALQLQAVNNDLEEKVKVRTEEIKKSEIQYRNLFENNPLPMWIFDPHTFRFLAVNRQAVMKYGYSEAEFIGMTLYDIRPEEEHERLKGIEPLIESFEGSQNRGVWKHITKAGNEILVEAWAQTIMFDGIEARLALLEDVTDKVHTENVVKASERRFRSLIENSFDLIVLLDASFRITYRSPSVNRTTGRTDEDTIGTDALAFIHPEDIEKVGKAIKELMHAPGSTVKCLFRYQKKDGTYLWMEGTATNLLHDADVQSIVFNYRDVSEKKEAEEKAKISEERYRNSLDTMIEGVQIIGYDKKYIYVNDAFSKQIGIPKEALIGRNLLELVPAMSENRIYQLAEECMAEQKSMQIENMFIFPGGFQIWFQLSLQPVPEGIFILSVDITDKVRAAKALKEERGKLESIAAVVPGLIYSFRMAPDGSFTMPYANNAVEEIYGFTFEQLKNNPQPIFDRIYPEDAEMIFREITASAENLTAWQVEHRYNHPEKGLVWHNGSSMPMREADGSTVWHGMIMDITEQKKAQQKITEQNAQLHTLSNNLPGVMIYQLTGTSLESRKFTYLSKEVTRITGCSPQEVMDNPFILYNSILEEDRAVMEQAEIDSYIHKTTFNVEVRSRNYKNEIRWLNIVSTPREVDKNTVVWDGFHLDITDRKNAEAEIKHSNERYESVANATSDAMWEHDYRTGKTFVLGNGYKNLFGYPIVNDYYDLKFWESRIHPDDRERVVKEEDRARDNKRITKGYVEYRLLKANGEYAYISDRFSITRDEDGAAIKMFGSKQDVTARKLAEEQLRKSLEENSIMASRLSTILNTLPANIALIDKKGIIQDVNQSWNESNKRLCPIIGKYTVGDNYLSAKGRSKNSTVDVKEMVVGIRAVLSGAKNDFVMEHSCELQNHKSWFRMIVTALRGNGFEGAVVMHIDITEVKRLEMERLKSQIDEQRKITQAMLQGQEKERNTIGIELHDNVNQILVGTNMLLSMISANRSMLEEFLPKCIENIRHAVNENRRISHELVTPNRVTETILQQITRLTQTMLNSVGLKTKINNKAFSDDLLSDEQKLTAYRIVQEQCTNILKHSKAEKVVITLSTTNSLFKMRIADNGIGLKNGKAEEGIGLKNIRNRLTVLDGTAVVESATGKGFALLVEMPLAQY